MVLSAYLELLREFHSAIHMLLELNCVSVQLLARLSQLILIYDMLGFKCGPLWKLIGDASEIDALDGFISTAQLRRLDSLSSVGNKWGARLLLGKV